MSTPPSPTSWASAAISSVISATRVRNSGVTHGVRRVVSNVHGAIAGARTGLSNIQNQYHILSGKEIEIRNNESEFEVSIPLMEANEVLNNADKVGGYLTRTLFSWNRTTCCQSSFAYTCKINNKGIRTP